MGDLDIKIKAINEKIKKEEQMRLAAVRVKSSTQNSMVVSQAEQNIVEASRHIDYLTKELEKLQVRQRNSLQYPQSSQYSGYYQQNQPQSQSYTYPQPTGGQQGHYATRSILPQQQPPYEDPTSIPVAARKTALSNLVCSPATF